MKKKVIIVICTISMLMLTACSDVNYIDSFGINKGTIQVPKKYSYIESYHWEDNKLIIEFGEDINE